MFIPLDLEIVGKRSESNLHFQIVSATRGWTPKMRYDSEWCWKEQLVAADHEFTFLLTITIITLLSIVAVLNLCDKVLSLEQKNFSEV